MIYGALIPRGGLISPSHLTGERLAIMRRKAGWTQRRLADRAGVHVQTVKYWEAKEAIIGGHACRRFLAVLAAKGITTKTVSVKEPTHVAAAQVKRLEKLCGAKTRKGTPCQMKPVPTRSRCKLHGGMSTGPKTAEGLDRIRQGQARRWSTYRGEIACSRGIADTR